MQGAVREEEKALREARRTLRWTPCYLAVVAGALALFVADLVRHPGADRLLYLLTPAGFLLLGWLYRRRAHAVLPGARCSWATPGLLIGMGLVASGGPLGDACRDGDMAALRFFGVLMLAAEAVSVALLASALQSYRRAAREARGEPAAPPGERAL